MTHDTWFVLSLAPVVYTFIIPCFLLVLVDIYFAFQLLITTKLAIHQLVSRKTMMAIQRRRRTQISVHIKLFTIVALVNSCACAVRFHSTEISKAVYFTAIALQGLVITASLICNCEALQVYSQVMKKKKTSYGTSAPPSSTSLQLLTWSPQTENV